MAEEIAVKIVLEGDIKGQMKRAAGSVKTSAGSMSKDMKNLKTAAVGAVAALVSIRAVVSLAKFFNDAAVAAGNLEEALSKQTVVFRGYEDKVRSMNTALVNTFKLSRREAAQFTATIQDTLIPLGVARGKAADMSFEVVKLARDLGSFNNLPTEQVVRDLQSALVGNVETLRKYGVALNETTIKQKAVEMGLIRSTKDAISPTSKALVVMKSTFEGSSDAIGDFERTADGFANQMASMKSKSEDLTAEIGISSQTAVLEWNKLIVKALEFTKDWAVGVNVLKEAFFGSELENLNKDIVENIAKTNIQTDKWVDANTALETYNAALKENVGMTKEEIQLLTGVNPVMTKVKEIEAARELNKLVKEKATLDAKKADLTASPEEKAAKLKAAADKSRREEEKVAKDKADKEAAALALETQAMATEARLEALQERHEQELQLQMDYQEIIKEADAKALDDFKENEEKKREELLRTQEIQENTLRATFAASSQFFGGMADLLRDAAKENEGAAAAYKAVAIAQATIDTFAAANASYKAMAGIPYVGPALGAIAAAGAIASGVANVASISSQSFATGGVVGGNSFSGDNVSANVNSGEMILNRSQQQNLFNAIDSGSVGASGGITVSDTIIINGNADDGAIAAIAQTREDQIEKMRGLLIEMQQVGQLPTGV